MNSARVALSWECWSRDKAAPSLALLACTAIVCVFYYAYQQLVTPVSPGSLATFHAVLFMTVLPIVVVCAGAVAGVPETRFTLPISTWTLVAWPMLNGCLATACAYLCLAVFANTLFAAQWPLLKPILAAATIYALCHAASWIPECGRLRPLIGVLSCAFLGVGTFGLHNDAAAHEFPPYWRALEWSEVALALALIGSAYAATVGGVSLARHGRPLSLTRIAEWLIERLDLHAPPPAVFASASHAQSWFEWVSKGITIPAASVFWSLCICAVFSTGWLASKSTVELIFVLTEMALMLAPLLGWFLGSAGSRFQINEFTATRPLGDTQLADRTLANAARSLFLGWSIWWAGVALSLGCAWLSGTAPETPAEFFPVKFPPATWPQAALYLLATVVACLIVSWTLISFGVWTALLRSWLICGLLSGGVGLTAGALLVPWSASATSVCLAMICLAITGGNLFAFAAALRLELIGWRRTAACSCLYLLVSTGFFCAATISLNAEPRRLVLPLVICQLPFTALAATPLAVWWNRHR